MTARSTSPTPRYYLMAHKPELGIKDPYELNEDQYKAALDLLRAQRTLVGRYWHDAMIQIDDFKNEGVVASGSWPFQVNLLKAENAAGRLDHPRGRRHRLGRHHDAARRRRATRTAPTCGWSTRSSPSCRATSRPGSARSRRCRPPARTDRGCRPRRAARPTASTTSTGSASGRRRSRNAPQGECVPYYRWVSDYIGVIGGR